MSVWLHSRPAIFKLPENLTAASFLERHWQKRPCYMPAALERVRPSVSRNELGWLATLDDVESRLVFVDRDGSKSRYRAESGPFDVEYLQQLPKRDWTLLVHDVEKHLPAMRALFCHIPFIPDWRIDDLMVSFAAPGGGVGPHRDNYDVFLCQGIGVRNWRFTRDDIEDDSAASDDLALLGEFEGDDDVDTSNGDVLYLPPGVAHWGYAKRACITFSIGMRAPQAGEIAYYLNCTAAEADAFYRDPDLLPDEARPGYISRASVRRAVDTMALPNDRHDDIAQALGQFVTLPKDWLKPDAATPQETASSLDYLQHGGHLDVHGMAQIAFDDSNAYANGSYTPLPADATTLLNELCGTRSLSSPTLGNIGQAEMLVWMLQQGVFEIPANF
jgi:50S ribosomal protein L16 3-hydroxylase